MKDTDKMLLTGGEKKENDNIMQKTGCLKLFVYLLNTPFNSKEELIKIVEKYIETNYEKK